MYSVDSMSAKPRLVPTCQNRKTFKRPIREKPHLALPQKLQLQAYNFKQLSKQRLIGRMIRGTEFPDGAC